MGVETELFGLKNRGDGKEFRVIERADGSIAVLAGEKVLVDSGVTPVTAVPSVSGTKKLGAEGAQAVAGFGYPAKPRLAAVVAPFSYIIAPGTANTSSFGLCINIPCVYDAVQIGYTHLGGGGACAGVKALVASTEDYGDKSLANTAAGKKFITPIKSGAEVNTVSATGWQAVTWAGAASVDFTDKGAGNVDFALSDIIPVAGIEDAANPGYAPLLVRMYPGAGAFSRSRYSGVSAPTKFIVDAGPNFVLGAVRSGDNVTTVSGWNAASTPSFGDTAYLPVFVVAYSGGQPVSIMTVGDSRMDGANEVAASKGYAGMAFKLQQQITASGTKNAIVRSAVAGMASINYQQRGVKLLSSGLSPTIALYQLYTVNDGLPTADVLSAARARCLAFLKQCQSAGTTPVILTSFPKTGGHGANMAGLVALDAWAASLGVLYLSPLSIYGDAAGAWVGGVNFDADHMTQAGYDDLATRLRELITPYF